MARYNQKGAIELAPREVCEYLTRELNRDMRDPKRKTLRELADWSGFSKSTLSRYSLKLKRLRIYQSKLERDHGTRSGGVAGRRIVVRMPDNRLVLSSQFDKLGFAISEGGLTSDVHYLTENQIQEKDVLLVVELKTSPIRNPQALEALEKSLQKSKSDSSKAQPEENTL